MKKRFIKHILFCLTLIWIFNYTYVYAEDSGLIQQEINDNNSQIDELEKQKENIEGEISSQEQALIDIDNRISEKRNDLSKAQEEVAKFQSEIDELQNQINSIEEQISTSETQITIKKENLVRLQEEKDAKEELLNSRIRNSYKINISNEYIYLIIKSENLWQAYENINQIWKIISLDKELINEVKEKEASIAAEMAQIDKELDKQKQNREEVVNKQTELVEAQKEFIAIKDNEENKMYELQLLQDDKQTIIAELEGEENKVTDDIESLLAYNEELQNKLNSIFESINNEENNNEEQLEELPADSGYLRPIDGVITDTFGGRINPVTGVPGNHNGTDYANATGTPILATKNGVVSYSGWIEGYGNTIILDHGQGVQSLYGHASSLAVGVGQTVSQGSIIAYVGSTGMSTGPHLHFEIRINGAPVDPFSYIPY